MMSTINKNNNKNPTSGILEVPESSQNLVQLDSTLRIVKSLTDHGEYARALDSLAKYTTDSELLNCRGVCLLRLHKFAEAISPFRMAALNMGSMRVHENLASHIKTNFAIALFFGGFPAGGLDTLAEFDHSKDDPSVQMLRRQAELWERNMSKMQRIYWKLTRIAPAVTPIPPAEPIGKFVWEVRVKK